MFPGCSNRAVRRPTSPRLPGAILILTVCGLIFSLMAFGCGGSTTETSLPSQTTAGAQLYSPLTGEPVASQADLTKPVTALMIDNITAARPQSGIKDAEVIFEAVSEGGITRLLVVYQQNKPQLIGPVRSVRTYYIDWAAPFDASIGHVGGNFDALAQIRNGSYRDIDQFFNPAAYMRTTDRPAPHNVYTSFQKLDALNKSKGYLTSHPEGFTRVDGSPVASPDATSISIKISGDAAYNSTYAYDQATNTYPRHQGGTPFVDREKGQVAPRVVIAMMVQEQTVFNGTEKEERITTVGQGTAYIFQNGTVINATWKKTGLTSQITFTDANGKDVPLVRGQTWIAAVSSSTGSVTWK